MDRIYTFFKVQFNQVSVAPSSPYRILPQSVIIVQHSLVYSFENDVLYFHLLKWLGASQTTSRESGCPTRPPQIWPGAILRDYINCLQVLVWPPGPNQLIQAVKRQFEANFVIFTGWMLAPITPKVVGQNPKYFRGLMYS